MFTSNLSADEAILGEQILSKVCWEEYLNQGREFKYNDLVRVIAFLKKGGARHIATDYSTAVTFALKELRVNEKSWTVLRALVSTAFKLYKDSQVRCPFNDRHWTITIDRRTHEIHLHHHSTLSYSDANYWLTGFELGSVRVESSPCTSRHIQQLHHTKCGMVTYELMSGRR